MSLQLYCSLLDWISSLINLDSFLNLISLRATFIRVDFCTNSATYLTLTISNTLSLPLNLSLSVSYYYPSIFRPLSHSLYLFVFFLALFSAFSFLYQYFIPCSYFFFLSPSFSSISLFLNTQFNTHSPFLHLSAFLPLHTFLC